MMNIDMKMINKPSQISSFGVAQLNSLLDSHQKNLVTPTIWTAQIQTTEGLAMQGGMCHDAMTHQGL